MLFTLDDRSKNLKESSANAIHAVKDKEDRLNRAFGDNVKGREDEQCEPMRTKGTNVDLFVSCAGAGVYRRSGWCPFIMLSK
jgi:hypothetical protein